MLSITVVQPDYFADTAPDQAAAEFLLQSLNSVQPGGLIVLPEYSNAGGLSDPERELAAMPRAKEMLEQASQTAKAKKAYVSINVLEEREGRIKNSTYLFDKNGNAAFVYDKIHLPPSEVTMGVERGSGACVCELDGIRFGFMTCYDIYYSEQIEYLAKHQPDVLLIPGYQRGERVDIIRSQIKLAAFRCNAYAARSSFSMRDEERGGCSMIVAPDGRILKDLGKTVGLTSQEVDVKWKHTRSAGFGCGIVRNDEFIAYGLCPELF